MMMKTELDLKALRESEREYYKNIVRLDEEQHKTEKQVISCHIVGIPKCLEFSQTHYRVHVPFFEN